MINSFQCQMKFRWQPLSVYNRVTGEKETLDAGEALVAVYGGSYENNTDILSIHNDIQLNVKKVISNFKADSYGWCSINKSLLYFCAGF